MKFIVLTNNQSLMWSFAGNSRSSSGCPGRPRTGLATWATGASRRCPTVRPGLTSPTKEDRSRLLTSSPSRRRRWCPTWTAWVWAACPPPGPALQELRPTSPRPLPPPPPPSPPGTASVNWTILIKSRRPSQLRAELCQPPPAEQGNQVGNMSSQAEHSAVSHWI